MTPIYGKGAWSLKRQAWLSENGELYDLARLRWGHTRQGSLVSLIKAGLWVPPACRSPVHITISEGQREVHPSIKPAGSAVLLVPCRKCDLCLLRRRRRWFVRMTHEVNLSPRTWFVTLTFRGDRGVGDYKAVQRWLKRLRKRCGAFRYVAVLEAGDLHGRLHWHLLIHCSRTVMVRDVRCDTTLGFVGVKLVSPERVSYLAHYAAGAMLKVHASLRYGVGRA